MQDFIDGESSSEEEVEHDYSLPARDSPPPPTRRAALEAADNFDGKLWKFVNY